MLCYGIDTESRVHENLDLPCLQALVLMQMGEKVLAYDLSFTKVPTA